MRKHRFFVDATLRVDQHFKLPEDIQHKISRVLRLVNGDVVYLFNNTGHEYQAVLENNGLKIIAMSATAEAPQLEIHLAQVIGKADTMDLVVQKATELGVASITPLFSQYSISTKTNKLAHWQKISIAACCQSWRNNLPIIHEPIALEQWIAQPRNHVQIIFAPTGGKLNQHHITSPITILVGPEGGFSPEEYALAHKYNFISIALGPRILRTETAGIAAIAILQALGGDM